MTGLEQLFDEHGQSPWLDNLTRPGLRDGSLSHLVAAGVRGVTANPTIVAKAIMASDAYDEQFETLVSSGHSVEDAYWYLVVADVVDALGIFRPTFESGDGGDGFVSIEVSPRCAHDTAASVSAARALHERVGQPNLLVKVPATSQGVPAIGTLIGEGLSINVTLIFSLSRYHQVLEAYLSGLEAFAERGGDLAAVHSVASCFVSRVDSEVDSRLESLGTDPALELRGQAAVAQARLAYQMFSDTHSGPRWTRLAERGARVQRPLWASTSTKNAQYPDTLYVDSLIGPDTVSTMPENTMKAFEDHGTLARTIDTDTAAATNVMNALATVGIDMEDVSHTLENQGIAAFEASFIEVLHALDTKAHALSGA